MAFESDVLARHPFFETFAPAARERLAACSTLREYPESTRVIGEGQPVQELGLVLKGTCAVLVSDADDGDFAKRRIATLGVHEMFGEMSLLTGEPATADVVADIGAQLLLIPHAKLSLELAQNPTGIQFLGRLISDRLRKRAQDERAEIAVENARRHERQARRYRPTAAPGVVPRVLVLNLGSSSLKYDFFDAAKPEVRARGLIERIGAAGARHVYRMGGGERTESLSIVDHAAALDVALRRLTDPEHGVLGDLAQLTAVGHRVVHGGSRYSEATVIDDQVLQEIEQLCRLAPLHNPVAVAGIKATRARLPGVPQVAVFDTAFHTTMPDHAWSYALPRALAERHGLQRYGFHGTSHRYVAKSAAAFLQRSSRELRLITCHLGNGASLCAIDHGRSVDTSMGLTPLEGLCMGTRSGDVDPGLVLFLCTSLGMTPDQVDHLLNRESGLLGISGLSQDMRELEQAAAGGHVGARLAIAVFCYRVKKYIGSYVAVLGGLDALVFTGGIGQGSAWVRARVCQGLAGMGIALDEMANRTPASDGSGIRRISDPSAPVAVSVVPTDEEAMIARETVTALGLREASEVARRVEDLPIPINTSAHHVHLSQPDVETLFGSGHTLTRRADLLQPGQFACEETVTLVGPRGAVERVRVLGPTRQRSQVEISRTEEFRLGIDAPIRASGDLDGSPGITLLGQAGEVRLQQGVICALRHIHMSPEDALRFAVRDKDLVRVKTAGERSIVFGDVLIRVSPDYRLEMHVDTDEANAAELDPGAIGFLDSIQYRRT
ncbi:MAG: acetate/propionate family kinase [Deltaproteobacteria bacterium]|nr:acetate/propionate family kinase [Deltaproteobacteria bacterium]